VRLSLALKFALISTLLVVVVAGLTSYLMVFRLAASVEQELFARDRELAKVLAGLRTSDGRLDFDTLSTFVNTSDKVKTGLVYVLELDGGGKLVAGSLNPRLFAALDPDYEVQIRQGRERVLASLAAGEIDREGTIKEYTLPLPRGQVRLGFDLQRIDQQIRAEQRVALAILAVGLALGVAASVVLARRMAAPVRKLAGAMDAVARGEMNQTVNVTSTDELASLASSFNKMTHALRDVGRTRDLLARYLSPEVVRRLLKESDPLEMVAEERAVTVVSIAFPEFSLLLHQQGPRETIHIVNEYFAGIIDAVVARHGTVDRLEGERLTAVWGAPFDVAEPELEAIHAAVAARFAVEQEGRRQEAASTPALSVCIGICTGRAVAGNIGSAQRVAYRVLGGAVELAGHIERMAQPGEILVSEATYGKVRRWVEARACTPLMLDELEEAVPLYRVEAVVDSAAEGAPG
jgi:class 3 adenylate cyclase